MASTNGRKLLQRSLIKSGVLKSPKIIEAFEKVDRAHFVPENLKDFAYDDRALPIASGQTISQPYTVAFMLELLSPKEGQQIMDVGSGSMWQTALLSQITGEKGRVYSIEVNPEVFEIGKRNISSYPELLERIEMYVQNAKNGLPQAAEKIGGFDDIIAAAEVKEVPKSWREQLKVGGRLVYPKNSSIFLEIKKSDSEFEKSEFPGFAFVPFIE